MSDDFYYEDDSRPLPHLVECEDAWGEENKLKIGRHPRFASNAELQKWAPVAQWCQENNVHPSFAMRAMSNRVIMRAVGHIQNVEFYKNVFQSRKYLEDCWPAYLQELGSVSVKPEECSNAETMALLTDVETILNILRVRHLDIDNPEHHEAIEKLLLSDLLLTSAASRLCVDPVSQRIKNKYLAEFLDWADKSRYRRAAVEEVSGESLESITKGGGA